MRTELFDFVLPEDRIALRPASPRDAAIARNVRRVRYLLKRMGIAIDK